MVDRRDGDVRNPCAIRAKILQDDGELDCVVENLSIHGAKLRVDEGIVLNRNCVLSMPLFEVLREERRVEVRWSIGTAIGVRFL